MSQRDKPLLNILAVLRDSSISASKFINIWASAQAG